MPIPQHVLSPLPSCHSRVSAHGACSEGVPGRHVPNLAKIYNQHLKENFVKCFDYEMSLHGNHGHRREHRSQTGSRAHDGNAPCGDIHDPGDKGRGDGRDNHDHPRRVLQASRREPTQH